MRVLCSTERLVYWMEIVRKRLTSRDGYTCCVPGCYNNTKNNRELSFYKFPREKVTRDKWINAIKRKAFIPTDHHLVCIGSNFSKIASGTIATPTTDCIATSILHHIFIIILTLY